MRTRSRYLAGLLVAVLALAAYLAVPAAIGRQHRRAQARAAAIAAAVRDPAGGTVRTPRSCVVGALRCVHVGRAADEVAAEMTAALRAASGREPRAQCETFWSTLSVRTYHCILAVDTGRGHAVFVFVDPAPRAKGTDVGISVD
jgi:hypothetical protein